jgi:hypothetical protein
LTKIRAFTIFSRLLRHGLRFGGLTDRMSSSARARTAQVSRAGRLSTALALLGVLVAINASLALAPAAQASQTAGLAPAGSLENALGSGSGQISGMVTAAASKAALAGIEVCAYSKLSEIGGELGEHCAMSNAAGEYAVSGLSAAEYTVEFYSLGGEFATQYYDEKDSFLEATKVPLAEGAAVSGIDAEMVAAGEITGTVTTGGAPLEDIKVCAVEIGDEFIAQCTSSGPTGDYTISRLPAAEYTVDFYSLSGSYVTQYYNDKSSLAGATKVPVAAGAMIGGIDAAMVAAGKISGTVTDASSNAPLENIKVCAYESGGEALVQCTSTSASGEYTISRLAAAEYTVGFSAVNGEYLTQYYSDKPSLAEAVKVTVANAVTASGIDAAMQPLEDAFAPANMAEAPPEISGTAEVGAILKCSKGSWTGNPEPNFAYQWLRDGTPISGATSRLYTVQTFDQAHALVCEVTASNFKGSVTVPSPPFEVPAETPANVEPPNIFGTPSVGSILSCEAGLWTGYPKPEFKYRWLRGEEAIEGATSSSYTVQAADRGQALRCEVTGTNPAGVASARSASVKVEASSNGTGTTGGAPTGSASVGVQSFIAAKNAAVSLSGAITSKAGAVLVPLRCWLTTGSCPKATIEVSVVEDVRGGSVTGIAASTGAGTAKRKVLVAKLSVTLRAGQSETVKVALNATGRKLLAGHRRFAARVSVVVEGTSIGARDVTISRPAKKT